LRAAQSAHPQLSTFNFLILTTLPSAYLLVSHGSRDPRPQIAVSRLAAQLSSLDPANLIGTAQLELADKPLHAQIIDFAQTLLEREIDKMVVLPLFLNPGVHVMDDIPAEIAQAKLELPAIEITVAPFFGTCANLTDLFAQNRLDLPDRSIILAHGSRRAGGNQTVDRLAAKLDLEPAYWSVAPSLTERVTALVAQGVTEIGILPYFLFAGGITDAIGESVAQLSKQFPQLRIILAEPIGNSPKLVMAIETMLSQWTVDSGQRSD
jgi:sirohydrochlorin cobaltochelatase